MSRRKAADVAANKKLQANARASIALRERKAAEAERRAALTDDERAAEDAKDERADAAYEARVETSMEAAKAADAVAAQEFQPRERTVDDFVYDPQQRERQFWDKVTGVPYSDKGMDSLIPRGQWEREENGRQVRPSLCICNVETKRTVEGSTWWPGRPQIIDNMAMTPDGAMNVKGARVFNMYQPPAPLPVPDGATPDAWIEHIRALWPQPAEHEHLFDYLAHTVQRPGEKINHGVVLAGEQGIGKDTALIPLQVALGKLFRDAEPDDILRRFNGHVRSVALLINETRPHKEESRASAFYEALKMLCAAGASPWIEMDVKYANPVKVPNIVRTFITTNHPLAMHIAPDDRRLFVLTSSRPAGGGFPPGYFDRLYADLDGGGAAAVARWLGERDISRFRPNAPPLKTAGWHEIVSSAEEIRRSGLDDVLDGFFAAHESDPPRVVFPVDLKRFVERAAFDDREAALHSLQADANQIQFKLRARGYVVMTPPNKEWSAKCRGTEWTSRRAFVHGTVPESDRLAAVKVAARSRAAEKAAARSSS